MPWYNGKTNNWRFGSDGGRVPRRGDPKRLNCRLLKRRGRRDPIARQHPRVVAHGDLEPGHHRRIERSDRGSEYLCEEGEAFTCFAGSTTIGFECCSAPATSPGPNGPHHHASEHATPTSNEKSQEGSREEFTR
jgi:hypothetical protein